MKEGQLELPLGFEDKDNEFEIQKRIYGKFGLDYDGLPRQLDRAEKEFFIKCLNEEVMEYIEAETIEQEYDAMLDLVTFAFDVLIRMGLPFRAGFIEVAKANYAKELAGLAGNSKRLWELDLVKPKGWQAPNLAGVIDEAFTKGMQWPQNFGEKK